MCLNAGAVALGSDRAGSGGGEEYPLDARSQDGRDASSAFSSIRSRHNAASFERREAAVEISDSPWAQLEALGSRDVGRKPNLWGCRSRSSVGFDDVVDSSDWVTGDGWGHDVSLPRRWTGALRAKLG
mmetsp:Transcript_27610/g.37445  ORF Transcript_27610/g.37445 Transcript_27610/m.37445 type:complete len:128 (+) Transcript_27610:855-1238(+)